MSTTSAFESKPTPTETEILEPIENRWSPRTFASTPVEGEKLAKLFEAARWAPSASNVQPWRYLVTERGTAAFAKLLSCLTKSNQRWNASVPVLVAAFYTPYRISQDGTPKPNGTAMHDLGLANSNLATQATALGLYVHFMSGFDGEQIKESFAIPAPFEPLVCFAIGYKIPFEDLSKDAQERESAPRARKPQREFVFGQAWDEPAAFTDFGV